MAKGDFTDPFAYGFRRGLAEQKAPTGKKGDRVFEGHYVDNGPAEQWRDDVLAKSKLVQPTGKTGWRATLSGSHEQPPFNDYSGGKSAKYSSANRKALDFQDAGDLPKAKGSRENDWRGNK